MFVSIERLYEEAINHVVQGSANGMAEFALRLYRNKGKKTGHPDIMRLAVLRWYFSFSADGARLLQQMILNDNRRPSQAHQAFHTIIAILEAMLGQDSIAGTKGYAPKTDSETLIWALFQLKLSYDGPAKAEKQEVNRYLENWLFRIPAGSEELTG